MESGEVNKIYERSDKRSKEEEDKGVGNGRTI